MHRRPHQFVSGFPLRGRNLDALGGRFPDMCGPYDVELGGSLFRVARSLDIPLYTGYTLAYLDLNSRPVRSTVTSERLELMQWGCPPCRKSSRRRT